MSHTDSIAAISTPLGEGGLAVVRISGRHALAIASKCFRPLGKSSVSPDQADSHTVQYGRVVLRDRVADEVLLTILRAPRTYTREDTVEMSCHGGLLPARLVLEALLAQGARLAGPGEFTQRAFLNGRLDLTQAEAVADLIHARTELSLAAAHSQLQGSLSRRINELRDSLMLVLAHVEAHIDFPDEDIAPDTHEQLLNRLDHALKFIADLLKTSREGQVLRNGVRAAIVGRTNVGKSSLLNRLLDRERAIVSAIPGTTRDTIEATASIRGLPVLFVDTAGMRDADDAIEQEGMRRGQAVIEEAELILHVLDGSEPLNLQDEKWLTQLAKRSRIIVVNKSDRPRRLELPTTLDQGCVATSCTTEKGIENLKDAIKTQVWEGNISADMLEVMINSRHQDALHRARTGIERTREAFAENLTLELVAVDLRIAVDAVGEIVGQTTTEDLLDSIFSQFCIGK